MFNRENPKNSEPQNGSRSWLDYIALYRLDEYHKKSFQQFDNIFYIYLTRWECEKFYFGLITANPAHLIAIFCTILSCPDKKDLL